MLGKGTPAWDYFVETEEAFGSEDLEPVQRPQSEERRGIHPRAAPPVVDFCPETRVDKLVDADGVSDRQLEGAGGGGRVHRVTCRRVRPAVIPVAAHDWPLVAGA